MVHPPKLSRSSLHLRHVVPSLHSTRHPLTFVLLSVVCSSYSNKNWDIVMRPLCSVCSKLRPNSLTCASYSNNLVLQPTNFMSSFRQPLSKAIFLRFKLVIGDLDVFARLALPHLITSFKAFLPHSRDLARTAVRTPSVRFLKQVHRILA